MLLYFFPLKDEVLGHSKLVLFSKNSSVYYNVKKYFSPVKLIIRIGV